MICYHDRNKLDDAGNYYSALGWAYARGKGKDIHSFEKEGRIFASCAGAAIYRKKVFEKIGYFDEEHFAYLEDIDVGYRARIFGYENWYVPAALVYHVGSGTSGSRYNQFKTRYSSRNNIYLQKYAGSSDYFESSFSGAGLWHEDPVFFPEGNGQGVCGRNQKWVPDQS